MVPELQGLVKRYLDEGRGRTPQSIAAAAENRVSASTVRRIAQGESSTVELQSVLAILQVTATLEESVAFLKTHFPSTGNYFEAVVAATGAREIADAETLRSLVDFESFVIVALASTELGTTRKTVVDRLGTASAITLDKLLESGVLTLKDSRYRSAQEHIFPCDNASIKAQIANCLPLIRDEHIGQKRQHCNIVTDGVTLEGQQAIHAHIQKSKVELDRLIAAHKGEIPIFCSLLMGTFSTETNHG